MIDDSVSRRHVALTVGSVLRGTILYYVIFIGHCASTAIKNDVISDCPAGLILLLARRPPGDL